MADARTTALRFARVVGDVVRGAAGVDAYERYLVHCRTHHPDRTPLDRDSFFRESERQRWHGTCRCC